MDYNEETIPQTEETWGRFSTLATVSAPESFHELPGQSLSGEPETSKTIWEAMMEEYYKERDEIDAYKQKKQETLPDYSLPEGSVVEYMETNVFSVLFPHLTSALMEAVRTDSLSNRQSTFDVLDLISEAMWNNNPKYPERAVENLNIHDMPWAQQILKDNPRPHFPKSWIYTPEVAAKTIQSFFKGYLVRKREDVQEMRQFWKILKREKMNHSKTESHSVASHNFLKSGKSVGI